MSIFGTARGVVDNAEGQIDNMKIQMHNKQFTQHENNGVSYSAVKECISDMAANNTNATLAEYKVGLKVSYYTNVAHTTKTVHCTQTGTSVNTLINGCTYLSSTTYKNKSYDIILEYSEQGIVNYINIVSYGAY